MLWNKILKVWIATAPISCASTAVDCTLFLPSAPSTVSPLVLFNERGDSRSLRVFSGLCEGASIRSYFPSAPMRYEFVPPASHATSIHPSCQTDCYSFTIIIIHNTNCFSRPSKQIIFIYFTVLFVLFLFQKHCTATCLTLPSTADMLALTLRNRWAQCRFPKITEILRKFWQKRINGILLLSQVTLSNTHFPKYFLRL